MTGFFKAESVYIKKWLCLEEAYYNLTQRSLYATPYDIYDTSNLYSDPYYGCTLSYLENKNLSKDINDSLMKIGQCNWKKNTCQTQNFKQF